MSTELEHAKSRASPGAAMRCTGLVAVRPAHSTSGASSSTASGPDTPARRARRDSAGTGWAPADTRVHRIGDTARQREQLCARGLAVVHQYQ